MDSIQRLQVMTLANSIIGVSILAMPYCFKQCGIVLSILLLLFSSVLSRLSCHFLIKSAIKAKLKTFENLAFRAFGPLGKFAVEIGLIGFLIGTCIAFFVVMGDLGPQIVAQLSETQATSQLRTLILVSLAVFCVLPLGLLRNVESLSGVCTATIGFYACLVLKIISESTPHILSGDWIGNVDYWKPAGILQCIPIFSMALFCQTQLFEIYQTMPNASLDKMNAVVRIATHICTCVYVFVGVFGYIAVSGHGAPLGGNILLAFRSSLITEIIKIGFVLSVAFSFPLVIFPCRASIYSLLYKSSYSLLETNSINNMSNHASAPPIYIPETKFRFITVLVVATSLFIGIIIPNIELVLGLVGSTIGIMICVIFPATSFICLTTKNTNERIGAQIMLGIGVLVMVLGSYANFYAIEEVAINPIDAVKPIQIENVPKVESVIESFEEKFQKVEEPKIDVEKDNKLQEINNNISKDPVKEKKVEEVEKILEPSNEKLKEGLIEVRHEPVQPEEPIEEPKKGEEVKIEAAKPEMVVEEKVAQHKNISRQETVVSKKMDTKIDDAAILKEDAEELEQKKKEVQQESKKNDEILENLQKQNELQQELVQEQKKILGELKELKKIALEETQQKIEPKQQAEEIIPKVINEIVNNDSVNKQKEETELNKHKLVIVNEVVENFVANSKQVDNKIEIIKVEPKVRSVEVPVQKSIENISELIPNKPVQDTVLKMLENQMEENKREDESRNDGQNKSAEEVKLKKHDATQNKETIVVQENDKENIVVQENDKDNVNSMRRDILSADEAGRVKRNVADEAEIKNEGEQCNNSSSVNLIVEKGDNVRYEGKFLGRELKSVESDNDKENP